MGLKDLRFPQILRRQGVCWSGGGTRLPGSVHTDNCTGDLERQTATKTVTGSMMGETMPDRDCLILCASDLLVFNLNMSVPRLKGRHEVLRLE